VAASLLARVAGDPVPVGRATAHHLTGTEDGWFGFLDTVDDEERGAPAVVALVRRAADLLTEECCTSLTGPASFRPDQEAGVQEGDAEEVTGRPRTSPWLASALVEAGLRAGEGRPTWRLPAAALAAPPPPPAPGLVRRLPPTLRTWADPRLLLAAPDWGRVLALPDIVGPWRAAGGPLGLARAAARRRWETAVVLELDGDPSILVPSLAGAADAAGYTSIVSPWAPPGAGPPETLHRLYHTAL
ncbi:MAG: hypothetical protein ABIS47_10595, partial [Acidimicrobiales bacterium]